MNELINQVIKHYRITKEIALGGMDTVYKAANQKLNRHVAIKVINPNLVSNPGLVNSFYKEQLDIPTTKGNSQRKQTAGHQANSKKQPHPDIKQALYEDDDNTLILTPE